VALAAWLAATALFGRWSWQDWSEPHWLEGDPLEVYARVAVAGAEAADGGSPLDHPPRLGAPFGADWTGYVTPDRLVFRLTGLLAREVGVMAAAQLMAAALLVLNALAFHVCARRLGARPEWAAALALAFAFAGSNVRWGVTLSLAQTFTLPPLVLLCAAAARRAPPRGTAGRTALGAALGVWLGLGNPYLAYFAGVVAGGALVLALVRRVPARRVAPLALLLAVLSTVFLAANLRYLGTPETAVASRGPSDFARYALRPAEWFVPPDDHRLPTLARWGESYRDATAGVGEPFYNYLGLVGAAGLLALVASRLRGGFLRPRLDPVLGLGWIVVFGVAGGLNTLVAAAGVDFFRAGTRIGVFAAVWALLHLAGALSRATRGRPRAVSVALAAGLAGFACWEQTPPLADRRGPEANLVRWEAYRSFTAQLEQKLPAQAEIFLLPATRFPEAGRTLELTDYKLFLPYLTSRSLAFSYGHLATSREHRWVRWIRGLPPAELVAVLEQAGFEALWIDRRGVPQGARPFIASLRDLGLEQVPAPDELPFVAVFRLRPAAPAVRPDLDDPRLAEAWDERARRQGGVELLASTGWWPAERGDGRHWRWSAGKAVLDLWNGGPPARVRLAFGTMGWDGTSLALRVGGEERWRGRLRNGPARRHQVELELPPGLTRLEWELDGRAVQMKDALDRRLLGFALENVKVGPP
jgi:hypothetical protein